jgi:S-adenosylmethionine hydrolase
VAIVTFTTDFGSSDGYAGAMKGVVLSLAPSATLVDITHGIAARDVAGGAFALAQAAPLFPAGTIHVAVVDPGVGTARADLLVEAGGSLFVGPDNGLLSLAARPPRRIYRIAARDFRREPVSPTFHGRDVFAQAAGRLASGRAAADAGPPLSELVDLTPPPARVIDGGVEGSVVHVDGFGNLVTSLTADQIGGGSGSLAGVVVELAGPDAIVHARFGRTFADAAPGGLVAYAGSSGRLEIAVRDGSAAAVTGASRGSVVRVRRPS